MVCCRGVRGLRRLMSDPEAGKMSKVPCLGIVYKVADPE